MNADNFGKLFKNVLPSKLVSETACQVLQRDAAMAGRSSSAHSIGSDSTHTCVGCVQATGPDQRSARRLSHSAASADGCPGMLLPRRHLFTTSLSHPDPLHPADRRASSEATLVIFLFHTPASPIQRRRIQAPQRRRLQQLGPVVASFSPFHRGDEEMSDMGRQLLPNEALELTGTFSGNLEGSR